MLHRVLTPSEACKTGDEMPMNASVRGGLPAVQVLAKKMIAIMELSQQQLSKQDHYDYGLRSFVIPIARAAGMLFLPTLPSGFFLLNCLPLSRSACWQLLCPALGVHTSRYRQLPSAKSMHDFMPIASRVKVMQGQDSTCKDDLCTSFLVQCQNWVGMAFLTLGGLFHRCPEAWGPGGV